MINTLKSYLRSNFSATYRVMQRLSRLRWYFGSNEEKFTKIYRKNIWGDIESASGPGSNMEATKKIREELPDLIKKMEVKSVLDIPCGDFTWMAHVDVALENYIGADLVKEIVKKNIERYALPNRSFACLDLTADPLPRTDMLLVRDCLVHFSYNDIWRAIENIKRSGSTYLLTTTFLGTEKNTNIPTGDWRSINFRREPFFFCEPVQTIYEDSHMDKSLCLWKVKDLPDKLFAG